MHIREEVHQAIETSQRVPRIFKNAVADAANLLRWSEVEWALNNSLWLPPNCVATIDRDGRKRATPILANGLWSQNPEIDGRCIFEQIRAGDSFVLHNASRINKAVNDLCHEIEECHGGHVDAHLYAGLKDSSRSFEIHWDRPYNLIVQVDGVSRWKLYSNAQEEFAGAYFENDEKLNLVADELVEPGDLVYVPARCYHWCIPQGKRMSLSFPLVIGTGRPVTREWFRFD